MKIEDLRQLVGADFIVVGDENALRIVHPDEDKIGKKMVGGDSKAALKGERYISVAHGSLGESIRVGWFFSTINRSAYSLSQ